MTKIEIIKEVMAKYKNPACVPVDRNTGSENTGDKNCPIKNALLSPPRRLVLLAGEAFSMKNRLEFGISNPRP